MAVSNPKSPNKMAREVFTKLLNHPNIHLQWIKAHIDYIGNETADALAKEEKIWTEGDTGCSTYNIIPTISLHPSNWTRDDTIFFTGHGPFQFYLHRFNLSPTSFYPCGQVGTPLHYATECLLTLSWHMTKPARQHEEQWFRNFTANHQSRTRIRAIIQHIHINQPLFRPD
ncbi:hypothetical protein AVEN_229364-1 [Araneus ventricosus]|uniref:Uncharacterized protein n=1 Tax=Araneus ventricosus TaxID=182803 RepID=A0A4Y2I3T1_ARAVE|nr:hypothetical protein AVEN_229364-1 [Araneus ventricosus]